MPRGTDMEAADRRRRVQELELQGHTAAAIAEKVGADARTVQADLRLLAAERARDLDLSAERHRLLEAGRTVEAAAWVMLASLPEKDINGRLGLCPKCASSA